MGPANASRWSFESDPDALLDHPSLQPDRIADTNVFLSSAFTEGALEVLKRHGITHILQAGGNLQLPAQPCCKIACSGPDYAVLYHGVSERACMSAACVPDAWLVQVGFELEAHHPGAFTYCSIQVADRFESDIVQCLPQAFAFITHGIQDGKQQQCGMVLCGCAAWRCVGQLTMRQHTTVLRVLQIYCEHFASYPPILPSGQSCNLQAPRMRSLVAPDQVLDGTSRLLVFLSARPRACALPAWTVPQRCSRHRLPHVEQRADV